ncbi:hypothetical protein H8959_002568 [Pygathrix nigripes]
MRSTYARALAIAPPPNPVGLCGMIFNHLSVPISVSLFYGGWVYAHVGIEESSMLQASTFSLALEEFESSNDPAPAFEGRPCGFSVGLPSGLPFRVAVQNTDYITEPERDYGWLDPATQSRKGAFHSKCKMINVLFRSP